MPSTPSRRATLGPTVPSHQKLTASRRMSIGGGDGDTITTNNSGLPTNRPPQPGLREGGGGGRGKRQSMIPRVGRENNIAGLPSTPGRKPPTSATGGGGGGTHQKPINRRRSSIGIGGGRGGGGGTSSSTGAAVRTPVQTRSRAPRHSMSGVPTPTQQRRAPRQSMSGLPTPTAQPRTNRAPRHSIAATPSGQPRNNRAPRHSIAATPTSTTATKGRRRSSIGIGGAGPPLPQQGGRRQSLLPPSQDGANVVAAALPATGSEGDLRPLKDKQYQKQCISRLLKFLVNSGYPNPISPKSLSSPSSRDFANIVTFMLRRIDPNFQRFDTSDDRDTANLTVTLRPPASSPTMKFEDEVCMHFKAVGYPFSLSKTALVSAGSPNSWPGLLAALTWYMEHLELLEGIQPVDYLRETKPFESIEELEIKTEKVFFQYYQEYYHAFMTSDDALQNAVQDDFIRRFDYDASLLENETDRVKYQNRAIEERMNVMKGEINSVHEYTQKKEEYNQTLEQMKDMTKELTEQKKVLGNKIRDREKSLLDIKHKYQHTNDTIKELKHTIKNQELSVNDVARMENECKGITESIHRLELADKKHQEELAACEEEVRKRSNECESEIGLYNNKLDEAATATSASVAPAAQKLGDLKASLNIDKLLSSCDEALGISIDDQVLPVIGQAKEQLVNATSATEKKHEDALDTLAKTNEQLQASKTKKQIVADKISKAEETLQDEAAANKSKMEVHQRELQIMEGKVASIRDPSGVHGQKLSYERQLDDLRLQQNRLREEYRAKKEALREEIELGCQLMMEHEQHYQEKKEELEQYWSDKAEKEGCLQDIKVPNNLGLEEIEES